MKKEYKEFVINSLYGLIEGSPRSLEEMMTRDFKTKFNQTALIKVKYTDKFVELGSSHSCWIGTMSVSLTINSETFECCRDWGEEYENDIQHPDYKTDDYFYEGDKCFSYKKCKEAFEDLESKDILKFKEWNSK